VNGPACYAGSQEQRLTFAFFIGTIMLVGLPILRRLLPYKEAAN
jgi:hypothetical protein